MVGMTESLSDDSFDAELEHRVSEIFFSTRLDLATDFKIKLGRVESEGGDVFGNQGTGDVDVDYVLAVAEYRFHEVFGSTNLFAGPGAYRARQGDLEESDFGFTLGVGALFPITRRTGFLAELAYHWVNFDESTSFINLSAGLRFSF